MEGRAEEEDEGRRKRKGKGNRGKRGCEVVAEMACVCFADVILNHIPRLDWKN